MPDWVTLGTKEYTLNVESAVSLSGSIDLYFNDRPVTGDSVTGGVNSTLTAKYTIDATVNGNATKYVKLTIEVNGQEAKSKVIEITQSGTYRDELSFQFTQSGNYVVKAVIYEGDNMADWTELAEKDVNVKITESVENPSIQLKLDKTTATPDEPVNATITVTNPNNYQISGTIHLGYVANGQFQDKFQQNVTVPANASTPVQHQFKPSDWGLEPGNTYDIGAFGQFNINGNEITVSSNAVQLTVESESEIQPPEVALSATPNPANVNETVQIKAVVKNPNSQSGKVTVELQITDPNGNTTHAIPEGWSNVDISANGTKTLQYSFTPTKSGNYIFIANATLTIGQVQKSATSNTLTLSVNEEGSPAPPEMSLATDKSQINAGDPLQVIVNIKNVASDPIENGTVKILANGSVVATAQVGQIQPNESAMIQKQITLDTPGDISLVASGTFTIAGKQVNSTSNTVKVKVLAPQGDSFAVYLSYPNSITAGDGFNLTVSVKNTGTNDITSAKAEVSATQYDENGNPVATVGPTELDLGSIKPNESSSDSVLIMSKNVPGKITGTVKVTANFSDGKTLTKQATFSVDVTAPGGGTAGGGEVQISTPVLVGIGLIGGLLILAKRRGEGR